MRAYNDKRVIIEYARIHRIVVTESLFPLPPFIDDLYARMRAAQDQDDVGLWRLHQWTLGNLLRQGDSNTFSGMFGWYEEEPDPDAIPPRDKVTHSWIEETQNIRVGALALFVVDGESQQVAITSKSGDVATKGYCHALTQILNGQELKMKLRTSSRPDVDWLVEPVSEVGAFRSWMSRQDSVRSVSFSFHLPNPDITEDIKPMTDLLRESGGTDGLVRVQNKKGGSLTPENNKLLAAGIAMEENNYADVSSNGVSDGKENTFKSRDHTAKDTVHPPVARRPTVAEAAAILMEALAARLRHER